MLKNWRQLFVKSEEEEIVKTSNTTTSSPTTPYAFPVADAKNLESRIAVEPLTNEGLVNQAGSPILDEVLSIYESGLSSINMPGYDFYEFYMALSSTGIHDRQMYTLAFKMAIAMDKSVTPGKFISDAEYYINKIEEVHGEYHRQGKEKLQAIADKTEQERRGLQNSITEHAARITALKAELNTLEQQLVQQRQQLDKLAAGNQPQEKAIRDKMHANDQAHAASIEKLKAVQQNIQRFITG